MTVRRPLAIALALVSLGILCAAGFADTWMPGEHSTELDPVLTRAHPNSARLACPPGVLDSFNPSAPGAVASLWSSAGFDPSAPAPTILHAQGHDQLDLELPTGIVVAGQGGGELIGLSTTGCALPSSSQWVLIGPTTSGNDAVLIVSNPSDTPSEVAIRGYGARGALDERAHMVTVPARSSVDVLPVGWYADEDRLALQINANGPGVAAFAEISRMTGETPRGTTWTSGMQAQRSIWLLGAREETSAKVRIGVPGTQDAQVRIRTITAEGTTDIEGGALTIDAGTVLDVPVSAQSAEPVGFEIDSDVPIVAALDQSWDASPWPDTGAFWGIISALRPSLALSSAAILSAGELESLVTTQLEATPVRPSLVEGEFGAGEMTARLMCVLPADSDDASAKLELGGRSYSLKAGKALLVDLPDSSSTLTSSVPIRAALLVDVRTPKGIVRASWPLGTPGLRARQSEVSLAP